MIDKEEIEKEKNNGRRFISIDRVEKLFNRIKELEEINEEHQKLNGKLQKKVTYYEEICKGKSIQELGMSDLYKED